MLLATDRSGVMASTDGASNWTTSNNGYAHRYVSALLADNKDANTLYVGVVNDREYGGVFHSHDAGQHWLQKAAGLGGKDVFALKQAASGTLVAGTNHGIYSLEHNGTEWHPMNVVVIEHTSKTARKGRQSRDQTTIEKKELEARVNDLELGSDAGWRQPPAASTSAPIRAKPGRADRSSDRQDFRFRARRRFDRGRGDALQRIRFE